VIVFHGKEISGGVCPNSAVTAFLLFSYITPLPNSKQHARLEMSLEDIH